MISPQNPEVVEVSADGLCRKIGRGQMFDEGAKALDQLFPGRQIFLHPIPDRGQPFRSRQ